VPPPPERRAHRRLPARVNQTTLEWWDGWSSRNAPARIVDISLGGALIESEVPPPHGLDVWVRLEEPTSTSWVGGQIVRTEDGRAALAFREGCPRDFYEAAVLGIGYGNVFRGHRDF